MLLSRLGAVTLAAGADRAAMALASAATAGAALGGVRWLAAGGDPAQTSFRVIERPAGALLVEAQPHTGRTHQIRVHLAEGGHPICGDTLYGGPRQLRAPNGCPVAVPRTMLHAARLEFPHPVTGATVVEGSPMPADMAECLTALR